MPRDLDVDLCDEFAYTLLSYGSMAEVISSREDCPKIHGYYYRGPFEDDVDMLIGPDYSILLADSTLTRETQLDAYICGLRTSISSV